MSGEPASSTAIANCPCRCHWKAAAKLASGESRRQGAAGHGFFTAERYSGTVMAPAAFHLRNRTFPGAKPTPGRVLTTTAPSPRLWPLPSAAGVASALEVRIPVSREALHFVEIGRAHV